MCILIFLSIYCDRMRNYSDIGFNFCNVIFFDNLFIFVKVILVWD